MIKIRKAKDTDFEDIWDIFHQVVKKGDTFAFDPESNKADFKNLWIWLKLGFKIVGTVPKAFKHQRLGLVDVYIMHRFV